LETFVDVLDFKEKEWEGADWTHDRYQWRALVDRQLTVGVPHNAGFLWQA
jgi:hypothetical protein